VVFDKNLRLDLLYTFGVGPLDELGDYVSGKKHNKKMYGICT